MCQCLCTFHTTSLPDRIPLLISSLLIWHHSRCVSSLRSYILPISFGFLLDFKFHEPAYQCLSLLILPWHAACQGDFIQLPHVSLWVKKCSIVEDCWNLLTKTTPSMSVGSRSKSLMIWYIAIKHLPAVLRACRKKNTGTSLCQESQ